MPISNSLVSRSLRTWTSSSPIIFIFLNEKSREQLIVTGDDGAVTGLMEFTGRRVANLAAALLPGAHRIPFPFKAQVTI
jgi:hypothetical protein